MARPVNYKRIRNFLLVFTISSMVMLQAAHLHGNLFSKMGDQDKDAGKSSTAPIDSDARLSEKVERARKERAVSEEGKSNSISSEMEQSHVLRFSEMPPELILKNNYKGKFSLPNPSICSGKENITLLILITTAANHFELREAVRSTWVSFALRTDVAYAFVLGDSLFDKYNASVIEKLRLEIALYDDIIIASFEDYYRNLVVKTLYMLDWISTFCRQSTYFLKTDDDVFVNVPSLLEFIDAIKNEDTKIPKIYGDVFPANPPQRNSTHKHFVSYTLYPEDVNYPDFTTGPAYLMSTRIVRPLFEAALEFPYVPLEDVLVTGMVASSLNISRIHHAKFINERGGNPIDLKSCDLIGIYAGMTNGSAFQMYSVWQRYLEGKSVCKPTIS